MSLLVAVNEHCTGLEAFGDSSDEIEKKKHSLHDFKTKKNETLNIKNGKPSIQNMIGDCQPKT